MIGERCWAQNLLPWSIGLVRDYDVPAFSASVLMAWTAPEIGALAVLHFMVPNRFRQPPDFPGLDQLLAVGMAQRLRKSLPTRWKSIPLRFCQPVAERGDHVRQHFVAIGDDEWAVHGSYVSPASWARA